MLQTTPRLLSSREVAAVLGVSRATLGRLRADGTLRPVRLRPGGHPRFRADEIAELIERGRTDR